MAHDTGTPVVLVPGFWLGAWAWDEVVPVLHEAGLHPVPVTLPGLEHRDADRRGITVEDHVRALQEVVEEQGEPVVLVAHSGGAWPAHMLVDRRPDLVRRAVYVDTGPTLEGIAPGTADPGQTEVPFPDDDALGELGVEGLTEADLRELRARAVPEPAGVVSAPMRLSDDRRFTVPVTVICTSLPTVQLQELTAAGQIPSELPDLRVTYVDLPTGHWPMFSRPADLAAALVDAARQD